MTRDTLPTATSEVLNIPETDMPEVVRSLMNERCLSALVKDIHREMRSPDPALRQQAKVALARLGFAE